MKAAHIALVALGFAVAATAPHAQSPAFDSVSVVTNTSGEDAPSGLRLMPDGGLKAVNVPLLRLIESAYQRHAFDSRLVEGGPAWVHEARFDLEARAAGGHEFEADAFPRLTWMKLRSALAARFNLRVRTDQRPMPVYELRVAQPGGQPGPRLQKADVDCGAEMRKKTQDEPEEGRQAGRPVCAVATYSGRLVADSVTMPALASLLSRTLDRPVVDRTGLPGGYAIELEAAELRAQGPVGPSDRPSTTTQSIFAAMPEQLGLELRPADGTIEVLVIERAERPR